MNTRRAAGRWEVAAGLWASLEASWAIEGSSGVAGCSGVRGHAGGDGTVTASLEANHVSARWAAGRQEVAAGSWASLEASWASCRREWLRARAIKSAPAPELEPKTWLQ